MIRLYSVIRAYKSRPLSLLCASCVDAAHRSLFAVDQDDIELCTIPSGRFFCLRLPPPANCCFSKSSQSESVYFSDDDEPLSLVYINKDWFLFSSYGGLQGNPMGKEKVNTLWYSTDTQLWRPPQSFVLVGRRGRQLYQQILYTTHGKPIKLASS